MGLNLCDRCAADCRHERNPNEIVVKCGAYKLPMTNADRIRSMSDEELAEFLSDFKDCAKDCLVGKGVKDCSGICATSETLRMWLQQPEEEET